MDIVWWWIMAALGVFCLAGIGFELARIASALESRKTTK